MKTIASVVEDNLCSGCGACYAICPTQAIEMTKTSMGRFSPSVFEERCTDCGLCRKACPSTDYFGLMFPKTNDPYLGHIENIYTGNSTNPRIHKNAQSGGAVTAILSYLFTEDKIDAAVVCVREYGSSHVNISPHIITNKDELHNSQKSNYTTVDMCSILRQTNEYKKLAFVGLPCQLQGLESLKMTSSKFKNISYKIGLVCDRIEADAFADCVIGKKLKNAPFQLIARDKTGGKYKKSPVCVVYSNGSVHYIPHKRRVLFKEPFTIPRCRVCFDKLAVHADIVCGDPWGMENVDWENGSSLLITRTELGDSVIRDMHQKRHIDLNFANKYALEKGQQIQSRKFSISRYVMALESLKKHDTLDLGYWRMLKQSVSIHGVEKNSIKCIKSFINLEKMTREQIVKQVKFSIMIQELKRLLKIIVNPKRLLKNLHI